MSGCGNSGCPCGNDCKCGSSCSCGSKKYMDIQDRVEGLECDKDGCKCGPNCSCNPCTCN